MHCPRLRSSALLCTSFATLAIIGCGDNINESFDVTPSNVTMGIGGHVDLTATLQGHPVHGVGDATWTVDDAAIAIVSTMSTGVRVIGMAPGTAHAVGTVDGLRAEFTIDVDTHYALIALAVEPTTMTIAAGTNGPVTALATLPSGAHVDVSAAAQWTIDDPSIASLGDGMVHGVHAGSTVLHCAYNGFDTAIPVQVTSAGLMSLAITPPSPTLPRGTARQLTATGTFTDDSTQDLSASVAWSAAAPAVVSIDDRGMATGDTVGATTVTAAFGAVTATTSLTVTAAAVASLTITPAQPTTPVGLTVQLGATAVMTDGTTLDVTSQASWTAPSPATATVDGNGDVTGVAIGNAPIDVAFDGSAAQTTVAVTAATLARIDVTPTSSSIATGTTEALTATGVFSDGSTRDLTAAAAWTSGNPQVATVSTTGATTGLAPGSTTIVAAAGGMTGQAQLAVTSATILSLSIDAPSTSLPVGTTEQLTATAMFSDGSSQNVTTQATWSSDTPAAISVSNAAGTQGVASAAATGGATITATVGGASATVALTATTATLTRLDIAPTQMAVPVGNESPISVTAVYSDGTKTDVTAQAQYTSSATAIATVTGNLVTGRAIGSTSIAIAFGGATAQLPVTVTAATLVDFEVSPTALALPLGTTHALTATAVFSDGSTLDVTAQATWTSATPATASVSNAGGSHGVVTAGALGATNVFAVYNGLASSAAVTVTAATLTSIQLTPATIAVPLGTTTPLTATGIYSDGSAIDLTSQATWTSSFPLIASVNATGLVHGTLVGSVTITAQVGSQTATAQVNVTLALLLSIQVSPATATLPLGSSGQLGAIGVFSDGTTADLTAQVTWSSSVPATASVSNATGSAGALTSHAVGTATATASFGLVVGTATVTVSAATLSSIQMSPAALTLPAGTAGQLTATGVYSDGSSLDLTTQATWTSSAIASATVSNTAGHRGTVTGAAPGTATITATVGGMTATAQVTVSAATLTSIQIAPAGLTLPLGTSGQLTATGVYSDGSSLDLTSQVTWSSALPLIASVDPNGTAHAILLGSTTITASAQGVSGSAQVSVSAALLTQIQVTPAAVNVPLGTQTALTATGVFSDGSKLDVTAQVTWVSSATATATVSNAPGAHGVVASHAVGTTTITATAGLISGSALVSVGGATLASIAISPATLGLPVGVSGQLTATGTYTDGSTVDLSAQVTWTSLLPLVASVTPAGSVRGNAIGATVIGAALGGVSATATVTVSTAVLAQLQVTPATATFPLGTTQQLAATGVYSDGSKLDLTGAVTWTSSAPAVASVGSGLVGGGLALGRAQGGATITASIAGMSGSADLTITAAVLQSIAVTPALPVLARGTSVALAATATYSDGSTGDVTAQATWTSTLPAIASVTNAGSAAGTVTANAVGVTTVTATVGAISAPGALVTVTPAVLQSLQLTPPSLIIPRGLQSPIVAVGVYSDGSRQDLSAQVGYTTSNSSVATVSNVVGTVGLVTASGVGTATVTASLGGVSATVQVQVTAAILSTIVVAPTHLTLAAGLTSPLIATGMYSDGSQLDVTVSATWTSANPAVAAVSNIAGLVGTVTAKTVGATTISVSLGGVTATVPVTVTAALLQSLAITGNVGTLLTGAKLGATGTFSDGSTADLTTSVTWSSSNTLLGTISNALGLKGVVTALGLGNITATATLGSVSASAQVQLGGLL